MGRSLCRRIKKPVLAGEALFPLVGEAICTAPPVIDNLFRMGCLRGQFGNHVTPSDQECHRRIAAAAFQFRAGCTHAAVGDHHQCVLRAPGLDRVVCQQQRLCAAAQRMADIHRAHRVRQAQRSGDQRGALLFRESISGGGKNQQVDCAARAILEAAARGVHRHGHTVFISPRQRPFRPAFRCLPRQQGVGEAVRGNIDAPISNPAHSPLPSEAGG